MTVKRDKPAISFFLETDHVPSHAYILRTPEIRFCEDQDFKSWGVSMDVEGPAAMNAKAREGFHLRFYDEAEAMRFEAEFG